MPSSPDSSASSSDLYSPSEHTGEDGSHQLIGNSSAEKRSGMRQGEIPDEHNTFKDVVGLPESQMNGATQDWTARNGDGQNLPETFAPTNQAQSASQKRKREHEEENELQFQRHPFHPQGPQVAHDARPTLGQDTLPQSMALGEEPIDGDSSRIKRARTIDPISNGIGRAQPFRLPIEIWQHIFSFVPPVFLGRLLRVNRAFHASLTLATSEPVRSDQDNRSAVHPVSADEVWAASRKRFAPGLPRPTLGLSELERMRLLRGRHCQICGQAKLQNFATSSESPLESGPGDKGVRVIWPFAVRSCGPCLHKCSEKESALFVSPDCPYFLLPALPFAFVTATNHYVSNTALQGMAHLPPLKMEKHYYKPHIDDIKKRLNEARSLGAASAEEWVKGLPAEGKARIDDATRWEQWEYKGGLKKISLRPPPKVLTESVVSKGSVNGHQPKSELHSERSTPQLGSVSAKPSGEYGTSAPSALLDPTHSATTATPHFHPPWSAPAPYHDGFAQRPLNSFPQPRPERNIRDVNEAKAIRKAEIERRCGELDPPLSSNILNHMDSFQAAIQISQPLTDHAWEVLKPRLLAQRPYAEKKEAEKIRQDELLQEEYRQRRHQEAQLKETKEALDREWDTVQAPVRNKIGALADEIIAENWSNGDSVSKDTCAKFAADVLIFVRERFYADIAREDEAARAAGETVRVDQPNEPPTRKLILENMKWLFDTKVKPLTENYQKELFLCNGCDGNFKFYGFEGVVQHFAAKHTTALSMGSVVVHWRAEWPEHPPFNPNPTAAKAPHYKIPTPVNPPMQAPVSTDVQVQPYYGGYSQPTEQTAPLPAPQQTYDGAQPHPHGYPVQYSTPQNNAYPYAQTQAYQPYGQIPQPEQIQAAAYQGQPIYPTPPHGYSGYAPPQYGQPAGPTFGTPYGQTQYPTFTQSQDYARPGAYGADQNGQYYGPGAVAPQPGVYPQRPAPVHPSGLALDVYQKQLDELAKQAREVWFGTSGIKDIPQSVRIYVVIHQVASRFAATFTNEPSLAMFIDGLDNHAKMRPVRSLNGLACKTCVTTGSGAGFDQQHLAHSLIADRRLYTLPHLLNHFRSAHVDDPYAIREPSTAQDPSKPDWKRDMIELPEFSVIANLLNASGMDDNKLGLVATVFPEAFPTPLPRMLKGGNTGPVPYKNDHAAQKTASRAANLSSVHSDNPDHSRPFNMPYAAVQAPSPRVPSAEPPGEDEYDPHKPAFVGNMIKPEPSSMHRWDDPLHQSPTTTSRHQYSTDPSFITSTPTKVDHNPEYIREDNRYTTTSGRTTFGGPVAQNHTTVLDQRRSHDLNGYAYSQNNQSLYGKTSYNGGIRDNVSINQASARSASPSEAADHFLNNIPVSRSYVASSYPEDIPHRSASAWRDEAPNQDQQRAYDVVAKLERWKGDYNQAGQLSDNRPTLDSIRAAQNISRAVDDLATSQRAASRSHHDDEYRPPSQVQTSPIGGRTAPSPQPYGVYGPSRQTFVEPQYVMTDVGRQGERMSASHQPRDPYYRSRSRSPQTSSVERGYYRARSPGDGRRQEPLYHIVSPSMRQEPQVQRIVRGEYPAQTHYQYVEDRIPAEDRYGRRVEYVPVRYEDHRPSEPGRYVLAQPVEEPPTPQGYVRLEQSYGGQHVYERNGQMYRTEAASYHVEPYRGSQVYTHEYRY